MGDGSDIDQSYVFGFEESAESLEEPHVRAEFSCIFVFVEDEGPEFELISVEGLGVIWIFEIVYIVLVKETDISWEAGWEIIIIGAFFDFGIVFIMLKERCD